MPVATRKAAGIDEGVNEHAGPSRRSHERPRAGRAVIETVLTPGGRLHTRRE